MSKEEVNGVHDLNLDELSKYFHLPIADAAKQIGVCATVLKKICRRNDIPRWPHRKIKSIDKMIKTLESTLGRSPEDDVQIRKELTTLMKHREYVMKNPASLVKYKRKSSDSVNVSNKKQKTNDDENSFVSRNLNNHQYDDNVYHTNVHINTQLQNNLMHDYIRHTNPHNLTHLQTGNVYYPQYISQEMTDYPLISTGGEDSPRYLYHGPYIIMNHGTQETDLNDFHHHDLTSLPNTYLMPSNVKLNNNPSKVIKSDTHFQQQLHSLQQQQLHPIHQQQLQHLQLQQQQLLQQHIQQQQFQNGQKKAKVTKSDQNKPNVKVVDSTSVNFSNENQRIQGQNEIDHNENGNKLTLPIPDWYNEDKDNYLALQEKMGLI